MHGFYCTCVGFTILQLRCTSKTLHDDTALNLLSIQGHPTSCAKSCFSLSFSLVTWVGLCMAHPWHLKSSKERAFRLCGEICSLVISFKSSPLIFHAELRSEYQRLELPGTPKVLELLVRLRQHALWAALPLSELQRECRQLGADVVSQDEALRRLTASWLPPEEMPDFWKSQQGKEAVGPKDPKLPALQRVARHFQTLGLSATATPEELKRTYRRLLLQYHPDKNQDMPQDVANQKFREISEAHEAIVEFMKMEN
eukprot:symbB.v1.2.036609.t2/scaffold5205.1/size29850/1